MLLELPVFRRQRGTFEPYEVGHSTLEYSFPTPYEVELWYVTWTFVDTSIIVTREYNHVNGCIGIGNVIGLKAIVFNSLSACCQCNSILRARRLSFF